MSWTGSAVCFGPQPNPYNPDAPNLLGWCNIVDFGAIVGADSTNAINAAITKAQSFGYGVIYIPPGNFLSRGGHVISSSNVKVWGAGRQSSTITCTVANSALLTFTGSSGNEVCGLTLSRSVAATSGGDGIVFPDFTSMAVLSDILVTSQYRGVVLGPTDYSTFRNSWVLNNVSDGVVLSNTASNGQEQWILNNILSQANGGHGFNATFQAGPSGMTLGDWTDLATFDNGGSGIYISGIVYQVRMTGGFIGGDHGDEINLANCTGAYHKFSGVCVESSSTGNGLTLGPSVVDAVISGCKFNMNANDGILVEGGVISIVGTSCTFNGNSVSPARGAGIEVTGGSVTVVGCTLRNLPGSNSQLYGLYSTVDAIVCVGCNLGSNATSDLVVPASPVNSIITGNVGGPSYIPIYNSAGALLGTTGHIVQGQVGPVGSTGVYTVSLSGYAAFLTAGYTVIVWDLTGQVFTPVTTIVASAFSFNATAGHGYDFIAIGA